MIVLESLLCILVAWITYAMIKKSNQTPTRVSSFVSLAGFLLLFLIHQFYAFDFTRCASLILGSSFVGMSSHKIINDLEVILAGLIFAALYTNFSQVFSGLCGALGFSAFVALMTSRSLGWFFRSKQSLAEVSSNHGDSSL